ncbi:MAG: ATP/GTP-binding protein [Chromatiaceae bacterium]|nr:ATP/GTP-binding protein [Chromatiaceae bacterium]MCF7994031.1 ATP/GTP-binding protein [Chromatiaceae bacterium]MCF8016770.1 ATP/GTP-binding protein [Chromatiaceae bacterium]
MLLQFSVQNFACFADEALFSMVASSDLSHPHHVVQSAAGRKPRVLRLAALYGANGHGKSKLVEALRFVRDLVLDGTKAGDAIDRSPFRLDPERIRAPSRFELVIDHEGVEFSYGFAVDEERVHEEWLFARLTSRESRLFERVTDDHGHVQVEFGPALSGGSKKERQFLEFVAEGTRPNQLFLTEAQDRNVEQLQPVLTWLRRVLVIVSADDLPQPVAFKASRERSFVDYLTDFLKRAGTGIDGVTVEETPCELDDFFEDAPRELTKKIIGAIDRGNAVGLVVNPKSDVLTIYKNEGGDRVVGRLKTKHCSQNGQSVEFQFGEESSGTQRLMEILPILADAESSERVYVVDELDRKLHPALSRLFVETFVNRGDEPSRTQLIFTTHDTHLMDLQLLRRDEIWFLEKSRWGASVLYPMTDLKVRPDLKIEKGYLQGRFGAVPLIQAAVASEAQAC